ncbi:TPA: P-type conjugative transfer protein TrbG [Legionella pneumophila]|nr:P-type conjugative transfer protein TrbG [Legionella pneumophila subsp. pneumophila]HAU9810078.1 P-type conjugative transfer protein TrbG [Legionella pneumophila]HAU9905613.1 P-type conjugative transfer protein TrbG [Legionella pneumophila]HAU9927059.1 P-type conjugative transfer protein TrbG [Legionella pneumophila]HAU9930801.1 P-type conjugative transfer protein TrbG [Legionella pneumophila]
MKKQLLFALMCVPVVALASTSEDIADRYFSKKVVQLTPQEQSALSIGKKWQTGMATSKPVTARDGSIAFVYGSGQTQILCAVLQVCDVALQPGEQVNNLNVGDPRFLVEPAITGIGPAQRLHLLIKALDVGLDTSLVVTTDRRTYHLRLRSSRKQFMPYVSFIYPEDAQAKWDAIRVKETIERHNNTIPLTGEYLGNLNFNYCITGNTRWKPTRVFNDGVKTIIEMPQAMQQTQAPTLLVLRHGGLFKKAETVMVNYRVQNNRFIVDTVFDKAILIAGVGRNQEKITITRRK